MKEFGRIVVPYDFSECSGVALERALSIAKWSGAEVELLHVMPSWDGLTKPSEGPGNLKGLVTADLGMAAAFAIERGVKVSLVVREGVRVPTILAEADPGSLIVMGTHGRSGLPHAWLGSVAEGVLRKGACAVLTDSVREDKAKHFLMPFRKILCPHDFTLASQRALESALKLAEEGGASLAVIHAVEWYPDAAPTVRVQAGDYEKYIAKGARERLQGCLPRTIGPGIDVQMLVREGKPHVEVLKAATELKSDIIVLGGTVPGAVETALFGSNVARIVRHAPCPVLRIAS
jgi:nucleotide-binding universal stress UspA family protein